MERAIQMSKLRLAKTVYVIDGDRAVREGLVRVVDAAGCDARPCASVGDFLQQARGMRHSCVLLDVQALRQCTPEMLGNLRHIARLLPFIALSSVDNAWAHRQARDLGARSFFHKPVDSSALMDAIDWAASRDWPEA